MTSDAGKHRFFAESIAGGSVELSTGEAHHALHVLRLRDGAAVEVFDGAGGAAEGVFRPTGRKGGVIEIVERRQAADRSEPVIELAFATPKGKRLDWLIEKATELGAAALSPVVFERSIAGPGRGEGPSDRWRGTCIAAAKQCGADFLPEIRRARGLEEFLAAATAGARILGDSAGAAGAAEALAAGSVGGVAILIGPEGGLTEPERAGAIQAGFTPVRLGELTLRIETAAVALLAAVRACAGG